MIVASGNSCLSRTSTSAKISISWERLIRPDGSIFVFKGITGDAQGRGGALGYLDQQLFKRYAMPVLTTAITTLTSYYMATDENGSGETESSQQQAASDARQNFLTQMNSIFEEILNDKATIRPMTYIPAGTRIIIYPQVDLWLRSLERDDEESTVVVGGGQGLLDGKEGQRGERTTHSGGGNAGQVVYDESGNNAEPQRGGLVPSSTPSTQQQVVAPPPPVYTPQPAAPAPIIAPSRKSNSSSSSGKITSNNDVPQLF